MQARRKRQRGQTGWFASTPDARRFAFDWNRRGGNHLLAAVTLIQNWFEELKAKAGGQ